MFSWSIFFMILASVAGIVGYTGLSGTAVGFAKIMFLIGALLFLGSSVYFFIKQRKTTSDKNAFPN